MKLVLGVIGQKLIQVIVLHHLNALYNIFISGVVNVQRSLFLEDSVLLLLCVEVSVLLVIAVVKDGLRSSWRHLVTITIPLSFDKDGPINVGLLHFLYFRFEVFLFVGIHFLLVFSQVDTSCKLLINIELSFRKLVFFNES